jgi:hypothetical protein
MIKKKKTQQHISFFGKSKYLLKITYIGWVNQSIEETQPLPLNVAILFIETQWQMQRRFIHQALTILSTCPKCWGSVSRLSGYITKNMHSLFTDSFNKSLLRSCMSDSIQQHISYEKFTSPLNTLKWSNEIRLHVNENQKRKGIAMHISNKIDFKLKANKNLAPRNSFCNLGLVSIRKPQETCIPEYWTWAFSVTLPLPIVENL